MKIIYSGGYNKLSSESVRNSFIFTYYPLIQNAVNNGKKIAFVTLAKPDGYYNELLFPRYKDIADIINYSNLHRADWSSYDGIFFPGGNAVPLLAGLKKSGFDLVKLKKNAVLLGDSAGAYVLSSYFYDSPRGDLRGVEIKFVEGLNPEAKIITVAHKNNHVYCNDILLDKVNTFAKEKNLKVLVLDENEQKILVNGELVEVEKERLFVSE